jgi:hypothetical protein
MIRPPRPRTRHLLFAVALAAASLALPAAPASADGPHANLYCTMTFTSDIIPPVTPELRHNESTSHGLTGTADCTGTIDGYQVTGPGIFGQVTQGAGNCYEGGGQTQANVQLQTTGGIKTVIANSDYHYDNVAGIAGLHGEQTGPVNFIVVDGDCFNVPLSHNTSVFTGTVIT